MIDLWINYYNKRKGLHRGSTKEERAEALGNVICPKCKYQNKKGWVKRSGKCHLCGTTLSREYFKNKLLKEINK